MTTPTWTASLKINASAAQDAMHYALAAAGGAVDGLETAFTRDLEKTTPKAFYLDAIAYCAKAGIPLTKDIARPANSYARTQERAVVLARYIDQICQLAGVAAYNGETIAERATDLARWEFRSERLYTDLVRYFPHAARAGLVDAACLSALSPALPPSMR